MSDSQKPLIDTERAPDPLAQDEAAPMAAFGLSRRRLMQAGLAFAPLSCLPPGYALAAGPSPANWAGSQAPSNGSLQIFLRASKTLEAAPFAIGQVFRQGDLPAGATLTGPLGPLQLSVKNRWPDGSVKFAVLAAEVSVKEGQSLALPLQIVPGPASTQAGAAAKTVDKAHRVEQATSPGLDTAALKRTGVEASISCGDFGQVNWQGSDWDRPHANWVSGPLMSSWIYRKPVGTDAHLVAWLEVRLFASGAVEVLPWVENGYLTVPGPSNKAASYAFALGGRQRFAADIDLKHHQRTPLIAGSELSYWLGDAPGLSVRHDGLYLQATELVPSYLARLDSISRKLEGLAGSYEPLGAGDFRYSGDRMSSPGYQPPIGLLPEHDVCYLTSETFGTYDVVIRNGFSAGRYAIHYRDERTQRPLRFIDHPNLVICGESAFKDNGDSTKGQRTPKPSGSIPPQWDVAHSPSVGFLAYLISGRWYFMEEVQFATTANYLGKSDNMLMREGASGLVKTAIDAWQTRSCAWDWRSLVQALTVTPDEDTRLRPEFIRCVEANIAHFHGRYVRQPNNPFGWILPGETYNGRLSPGACWQQDFVTAAFGYSLSLDLPISQDASNKLRAFFHWKAQSIVRRLGDRSGFWYVNGAPYVMSISPVPIPDFVGGKGPWFKTDAEVYAATYPAPGPKWLGAEEGVLAAEFMPGDRSLWGNLMPAISYAVRHGVSGAQEAYGRVTSARNWSALRDAFQTNPVWAVRPAVRKPAWLQGKGVLQWIEIPNTKGAGGAAVDAYSGMAYSERSDEIFIASAGGHNDAFDNRVVSLRLADDAPRWVQRMEASTANERDVPYYSDGKPTSRHLYQEIFFVPQVNRVMHVGLKAPWGNGGTYFPTVDGFDPVSNRWDAKGTWADLPSKDSGACIIRATGEIYTSGLRRWSPRTNTWDAPVSRKLERYLLRWPLAHDSKRDQLFNLQWADGQGYGEQKLYASRIPLSGADQIEVQFVPSAALEAWIKEKPTYAAMDYDVEGDRFLFYSGIGEARGRVYSIRPADGNAPWSMELLQLAPGSILPPSSPDAGVQSRFKYVPALGGFVLLPRRDSNVFFLRLR